MEGKHKIIVTSTLVSIILLTVFSVLEVFDSKILNLDIKWLVVSGIPILIGLLLSGIVKSFKGFGVELETNLSEKIGFELVGTVESYPTPEITKQSMQFLFNMQPKEKSKIERLQFEIGKKNYYESFVVKEYINDLKNLRYIELIDREEKFVGLLPAGIFKDGRNQNQRESSSEYLEMLIKSIENESISNNFRDLITDSIKKNDSLIEAFKKFKVSGQGKQPNGNQILPVIDSNEKMIGVTSLIKLTNRIAEQVVKSEK